MVWPFASGYPESSAGDVDGQTFDYIIVGGGTAACVLASRLSEDLDVSVLIVSRGNVKDDWMSRVPLLGQAFQEKGPDVLALYSEPDERWTGQRVCTYTSKRLGGASRINGMMLTRGSPANYDRWAELGNDQWSWDKCEPWFRRMENASHIRPGAAYRGHNGPLVLRHMPRLLDIDKYWANVARDVGLPISKDLNDPQSPAMGFYDLDVMIDPAGHRISSFMGYLPKSVAVSRRGRLTICGGAVVTKLDCETRAGQQELAVKGVYMIDAQSKGTARQCYARARREVIVSCGALFSPQVLLLSGIGPKEQLESHKIPVVRDMPGVGSNLSDHVAFGVAMEVHPSDSYLRLTSPLFAIWQCITWLLFKTGFLAAGTTRQCLWVQSGAIDDETMEVRPSEKRQDASLTENIPDIECIFVGASFDEEYTKGRGYFGLFTTLTQPFSRGSITLASDDPLAYPKMHHPLITDPRDWPIARKAARFAVSYLERFRTGGYHFDAVWHRAPGMKPGTAGRDWKDVSDDEVDDFIRSRLSSILHPTSTCKMGSEDDAGVVGQDLKVHGFANLRVADASVFPSLTSAHTVAPTYMVAERCAAFIKKEWS